MSVIYVHISAFAANPQVRAVVFLFGVSLTGGTLLSVFPGPLGFLLALISLVVVVINLFMALFRVGSALFGRRWQLFGERLIVVVVAVPVIMTGLRSGDYVHLAVFYPYYREKIAQTTERPVRFRWGDQAVTVLDGYRMTSLLYDETGATTATIIPDDQGGCTFRDRLIADFFIELVVDSCSDFNR